MSKHNKIYSSDTSRVLAESNFHSNLARIHQHNSNPFRTWTAGINQFTDLNREQMKQYLGVNKAGIRKMKEMEKIGVENTTFPVEVNWVEKGVTTEVKDQVWE